MSKRPKRRSRGARRSSKRASGSGLLARISPLAWILGGSVFVLAFAVFLNLWQSGALAGPVEPSRSEDPASLPPLAESGPSLYGEHAMELIPEQTPAPYEPPENEPVARVHIPGPEHDFGRVVSRQDVAHVFTIQNTGDDDLLISNLVTSCGCTTAELSSSTIPPGKRADLTVYFDANYHETRGEVYRLVWFATNDPAQPWVELRVRADVVP